MMLKHILSYPIMEFSKDGKFKNIDEVFGDEKFVRSNTCHEQYVRRKKVWLQPWESIPISDYPYDLWELNQRAFGVMELVQYVSAGNEYASVVMCKESTVLSGIQSWQRHTGREADAILEHARQHVLNQACSVEIE